MGAPPSEDQVADMLSNPAIAQTMNEALSNPAFVDHMIQSNPMLARMPNAREMLQSPYFRNMMTNPEAIRTAARIRRMMGGQGGGDSAFPAPGVTDTTPDAPNSGGTAGDADFPGMPSIFGSPGGGGAANPFAALFGPGAFGAPSAPAAGSGATPAWPAAAPAETRDGATGAAGTTSSAQPQAGNAAQQAANPFAALFGGAPPQGAQGTNAANPFGLPPITPEAMQQMMQMWGMGSPTSPVAPAAPADNRPPEERYADQLRQLNDMGFFDFDRNIAALRRSGGSVQGAIEHLLNGS